MLGIVLAHRVHTPPIVFTKYLVPGVQLVNAVIDLIEGYVATAIARGFYSGFLLLCIAAGMALSILIFGINNFY